MIRLSWRYVTGLVLLAAAAGAALQADDATPPAKPPAGPVKTRLVIAGYPDTAEWLMADVFRRLAAAYARTDPNTEVVIDRGLSYARGRKRVLSGSVGGIMITEPTNEVRAAKGQDGKKRGFRKLEMDKFIPVAKRVIRSRRRILAEVRLGIATARLSPELQGFLDFLSTEAARKALRAVPYVEPVERLAEPRAVREITIHGKKVTLTQPIWTY